MFDLGSYVACIAEGGAETAILELLLDHHLLIFEKDRLIDEKILTCRSANAFESRYLRMGFEGKITVFRVLDSRRENFKLSKGKSIIVRCRALAGHYDILWPGITSVPGRTLCLYWPDSCSDCTSAYVFSFR